MPKLTQANLHRIPIALPPRHEQEKIVELLGTLDDKIELNRRMAETLESMARTLFKSWFVDFEPVHAKAEGRPTNLPDNVAALFPDRFDVDVPKGWERKPIRPTLSCSIVRGLSPAYADEGILVLNQKCVRGGRVDLTMARRHNASHKIVSEERLLRPGDIVVNSTGVGTLGRVAQVRRIREPLTADGHVTMVRPNAKQISENLLGLGLLFLEPLIETLGQGSTGQTELSRDTVGELQVVLADERLRNVFDELTIPLRDRADEAIEEAETLASLRDTLLPKLISGELRIADAEKRIAAA